MVIKTNDKFYIATPHQTVRIICMFVYFVFLKHTRVTSSYSYILYTCLSTVVTVYPTNQTRETAEIRACSIYNTHYV